MHVDLLIIRMLYTCVQIAVIGHGYDHGNLGVEPAQHP